MRKDLEANEVDMAFLLCLLLLTQCQDMLVNVSTPATSSHTLNYSLKINNTLSPFAKERKYLRSFAPSLA
ncbi:hypothetical protein Barb6_03125 [Bacteroidales bacterium Barb6]|nr:hypothetical protein Barb6_03125 [Bacteroidales bacterium Barb6]